MNIAPIEITVADIFVSFKDNQEAGVVAYGGNLDVRPPYKREFIYDDAKQEAFIHTIHKGFPLNVLYWAKNPYGAYELLDGQQRTLSFYKFVDGGFSVEPTTSLLGHREDIRLLRTIGCFIKPQSKKKSGVRYYGNILGLFVKL